MSINNSQASYMGFSNIDCTFFPCHEDVKEQFNCLFCYCPLIRYECPGDYSIIEINGLEIKGCMKCSIPHTGIEKSWNFIQVWLRKPITWSGKRVVDGLTTGIQLGVIDKRV